MHKNDKASSDFSKKKNLTGTALQLASWLNIISHADHAKITVLVQLTLDVS